MEKFSKIQNQPEITPEKAPVLWQGKHLTVKSVEGWEVVSEKDMVIALPFFTDRGEVMVRAEVVPSFTLRNPTHKHFLTLMSGSVEPGESPDATLRRELVEECGIKLTDRYRPEKVGEFMVSKGSVAKYHIYILELMPHHYEQVPATTDGSKAEKQSSNVMVKVRNLKNLTPQDMVTAYTIGAFVAKHQLNF